MEEIVKYRKLLILRAYLLSPELDGCKEVVLEFHFSTIEAIHSRT